MKNTKRTPTVILALFCVGLAIITSCAPVNRFTRIKQVPREYVMNYCGGEIKASRAVGL